MAEDSILPFTGHTKADIPPERVLDAAKEESINPAIVVGLDKEGELYLATSNGDQNLTLALLVRCVAKLSNSPDVFE